jgi:hypothetical protein
VYQMIFCMLSPVFPSFSGMAALRTSHQLFPGQCSCFRFFGTLYELRLSSTTLVSVQINPRFPMPSSRVLPSSLSKSSTENARWRQAHLKRDRALIQATLPLALVHECDQEAENLGLSRAAYLAGAISLAAEYRDQLVLRVRLLERQHGIVFRKQGSPIRARKLSP